MKISRHLSAALILATIIGFSGVWPPLYASQTTDSAFRPVYMDDKISLQLSGIGVLRYMGFIRIYNGAFYLPPNVPSDRALDDVAKRLEVKYLRSFKAEDFGKATISGIRKNLDPASYDRLESRILYHNGLYDNIAAGDRVSLTYIPSEGTHVAINGKTKGTIPGADFAAALFALWLGDKPFDAAFKRALLGGE